ncbi:hypothetical protein [Spirillospora sp. NBC_01491]|uniref:hypothetical protein n=1 Tax=Spirillospora sp. NBC_01491 TaxID=2976007 RepID=UPI002E340F53|nr:hypothetical protein [Spirillospora sp. NBC_01491]
MTREELIKRVERERVRRPRELGHERHAETVTERVAGYERDLPRFDPVTAKEAAENRRILADALGIRDTMPVADAPHLRGAA